MTDEERATNVISHIERLRDLLGKSPKEGATQRIYRSRGIMNGEYTVITLVQYLPGFQSANGSSDVKVRLYINRAYLAVQTALIGQYSTDEIVAFLGLDRVPADSLMWADETHYNSLIEVHDTLRNMILHG
jgi:hypothetical protein